MSVATSTALIIGGGLLAGGTITSAALQSKAAGQAANLQSQAATHAADVQGTSTQAALDFQKQQAAQDLATAQATQQANYQQWAAKQQRLSTMGQSVGLAPFTIPPYVPIPNANAGVPPPSTTAPLSTLAGGAAQLAANMSAGGQPAFQPPPLVPAPGTPPSTNPYVTSIGSVIRPPSA